MKCSDCKYFVIAGLPNYGSCHRYPQVLNISSNYWCGEHQEIVQNITQNSIQETVQNNVQIVKPRGKRNVSKTASE